MIWLKIRLTSITVSGIDDSERAQNIQEPYKLIILNHLYLKALHSY